jgi:hypothetical protein
LAAGEREPAGRMLALAERWSGDYYALVPLRQALAPLLQ